MTNGLEYLQLCTIYGIETLKSPVTNKFKVINLTSL